MAEHPDVAQSISTADFDLDIQIRIASREVDKFDAGETETCQTCGSCTSECGGAATAGGCREFVLYEDRVEFIVNQVGADGVSRKFERAGTMRRVERAER